MSKRSVFISYGRLDAEAFAARLQDDLSARGHRVWRDLTNLATRPGADWMAGIVEGIRNCDIVIALLTPHSVRGSSDLSATRDSVCLDELAFARFGTPPKPILPVRISPCEPPLVIARLQAIDVAALPTEDAYSTALSSISATLSDLERRSGNRLSASGELDFGSYISEKTQNFFGRHWLFREMKVWLLEPGAPNCSLIVGDPGIGKTAFLAELMVRNPMNAICGAWFCRSDQPETCNASAFVSHMDAVLSTQIPGYGEPISNTFRRSSSVQAFLDIISRLNALPSPSVHKAFLIDALDESMSRQTASDTIPNTISRAVALFPSWFRLLMTSRKDERILSKLSALTPRVIDGGSVQNGEDVIGYITMRLQSAAMHGIACYSNASEQNLRGIISRQSAGNFLYANQLLSDLESGRVRPEEVSSLPPSLRGPYERFFERKFHDIAHFELLRQFFSVMLVSRVTLDAGDFSKILLMPTQADLFDQLAIAEEYVISAETAGGIYLRPFHKSLLDWLSSGNHRFRIDAKIGHSRIVDALLKRGNASVVHKFSMEQAFYHFKESGRTLDLGRFLSGQYTWQVMFALDRYRGIGGAFGISKAPSEIVPALADMDPGECRVVLLLVLEGLVKSAEYFVNNYVWKYIEPIYRTGGSTKQLDVDGDQVQEFGRGLAGIVDVLDISGRLLRDLMQPSDIGKIGNAMKEEYDRLSICLQKLETASSILGDFSFYGVNRNYNMSGAYDDTTGAVYRDFHEILSAFSGKAQDLKLL